MFYEIGQILMWAQHLYILYNLNVPPTLLATGLAPLVHLPWLCYGMAHITITNKLDSRRMWYVLIMILKTQINIKIAENESEA